VPLLDSSVLAVGDEIVRVDGTNVTPDDGAAVRPVYGGSLWLIEPEALAGLAGGDTPERRLEMIGDGQDWISLDAMHRLGTVDHLCQPTYQGVACDDGLYLEGTIINQVAAAPDGSIWAVGSFEGEGGGLYRISPR
jgi:hypothetical protein